MRFFLSLSNLLLLVVLLRAQSIQIPLGRLETHEVSPSDKISLSADTNGHITEHRAPSAFYGIVRANNQELPVLFSTTAESSFIVSELCATCSARKKFQCHNDSNCNLTDQLVSTDNNRVNGELASAVFEFDSQTAEKMDFVLADSVSYPLAQSGVLSLSRKSGNIVDQLYKNALINRRTFAFNYSPNKPVLQFGVSEAHMQPLNFSPLENHENWAIKLNGISINEASVTTEPLTAVLDTSIQTILIPSKMVNRMKHHLEKNGWKCHDVNGTIKCIKPKGSSFLLGLKIQSKSYLIPSKSLMGECESDLNKNADGFCVTNMEINNINDDVIIGEPILQHFNILYDADIGRIGLAETIIENSEDSDNKKEALKHVLTMLAVAFLCILTFFAFAWIARRFILRKRANHILFDDDIQGDQIEFGSR